MVKVDLSYYHTDWMDKALTKTIAGQGTANITGLDAHHQGVEFASEIRPTKKLFINLMGSMGDWRWGKNVSADAYDQYGTPLGKVNIYCNNVHVGNAAQTTAAAGFDYEILPKFKIGFDYNYYARLYADFDVTTRTSAPKEGQSIPDSWRMPDYQLVDFNVKYKFSFGKLDATLYGKVNNLFNTEYISDGVDGANHDVYTTPVFFGFGRTWSLSLDVKF
jgi:outer membrane receptor protein involved in Fe transport